MRALCGAGDAVFWRVGFAERNDPGAAISGGQSTILSVDDVAGELAAIAAWPASDGHAEILDEEGNAFEGAIGERAFGFLAGVLIPFIDHCIEGWIVPLDPFDGGFDQLNWGYFTLGDEGRQA